MNNGRKKQRWHLMYYLKIFDAISGDLVGHMVDFSTDGIMVISEQAFDIEIDFTFRMEIPMEDGHRETVTLIAQSKWSKPDLNDHFYDTGFKIKQMSNKAKTAIAMLIEQLNATAEH